MKVFGSKNLVACLSRLKFLRVVSSGSSHVKFKCPKKVSPGTRPFITVILNKKSYDPRTRSRYLRQIRNLGYEDKDLKEIVEGS